MQTGEEVVPLKYCHVFMLVSDIVLDSVPVQQDGSFNL
jgi:hypothetical protein